MRNIEGRMDDVTLENGRRKIARECRDKLKQLKKLSERHKKFPPIMWLTYYVNSIDKEINSG